MNGYPRELSAAVEPHTAEACQYTNDANS